MRLYASNLVEYVQYRPLHGSLEFFPNIKTRPLAGVLRPSFRPSMGRDNLPAQNSPRSPPPAIVLLGFISTASAAESFQSRWGLGAHPYAVHRLPRPLQRKWDKPRRVSVSGRVPWFSPPYNATIRAEILLIFNALANPKILFGPPAVLIVVIHSEHYDKQPF